MAQSNNILQELSGLESTLVNVTPQNVYTVPDGYFEGLANLVLNRIKAMEAGNASEELTYLSPMLNAVSRQMPYSVPADYFEGLENKMMQSVRESSDYQTAKEELETISPLLSGLKKEIPYSVPQGYFESLGEETNKPAAKVVSITGRKWFRYAAAAVIMGAVALAGLIYLNSTNRVDPVDQPYAWVKKNIKKVDKAEVDAFVKLADEEFSTQESLAVGPVKPEEIKDLMKDVSDKEIQDFLNETPDTDAGDDAMTN